MKTPPPKKIYKWAALVGAALGFVCPMLPPHYHAACTFISNACAGHF